MDALVLQLADSAFPAGGFAHSAGLEAAVQLGEVASAESLRAFVEASVRQAASLSLSFLRAAHAGGASGLATLDRESEAILTSHVARRASRTQGRAFFDTCARIFDGGEVASLVEVVRNERLAPHHAPIFGATTAALGVEREEAAGIFLHQSLRGVLSAAVRLGVAGTHEAQRMQRALAGVIGAAREKSIGVGVEGAAQIAPMAELVQGMADRLYSRMFQS
jgi:urease accessory protein